MQWFFDVKEIAKPALESVLSNEINFFPYNFKKTYKYWMER
jgi:valyl-tRNA synthetase